MSSTATDPQPVQAGRLVNWLATETARPRRVANWPHAGWLVVGTVCFGAFLGQFDASVVTLTFPALVARFHATLAGVEWVSLGYLLTVVALLAPAGRIADAFGRKQLYLAGFAVFTVASAACALAPTLSVLIGLRVLQAMGAALLQANSVALVTTSGPANRMRAALGVQAAAQALGLTLGPSLGGLVVDQLGWRWVFGLTVPVGVLGLVAGRYLLPRTRTRSPLGAFDWHGLVLLAVSTIATLLLVSWASGLVLFGEFTVALVALSLASGYAFVRRQRRIPTPLVDPDLVRRPVVTGGLAAAVGGYLVLFGPLVLVPMVLAGSATHSGLVLSALPAGFGLAAVLGAALPWPWPNRHRCVVGALLCVIALGGAAATAPDAAMLAAALGVLGIGLGVFTPANNAMVMSAIPVACSGVGGGLLNMARGLGTSVGIAAVTLTLHLTGASASWACGMLAVVAFGVTLVSARR